MSDIVGQICPVAFGFAPAGWLVCDGSLVSTTDQPGLFSVIGYTYGGSGGAFALPDLRGRTPIGVGKAPGLSTNLGERVGQERVTLTSSQTAAHSHALNSGQVGSVSTPASNALIGVGNSPAAGCVNFLPPAGAAVGAMVAQSIGSTPAGGQSHENRQPLMAINYIICCAGVVPED